MRRHGILQATVIATLLILAARAAGAAGAPVLPTDARLDPVRTQLQATVDQAAQNGLPAEALVSKVQEGLAKNVAPTRIVQVVGALASDYAAARAYAAPLIPGAAKPPAALLRALVDAKAVGIKWSDVTPLVRANVNRIDGLARAVEVLADLAARGYPTDHAVAVVGPVLLRDPQALTRLAADLDRVRRTHGMTQAETLDALATALSQGTGALDRAVQRVDEASERPGASPGTPSSDRGRGPNRDSSGNHGKK